MNSRLLSPPFTCQVSPNFSESVESMKKKSSTLPSATSFQSRKSKSSQIDEMTRVARHLQAIVIKDRVEKEKLRSEKEELEIDVSRLKQELEKRDPVTSLECQHLRKRLQSLTEQFDHLQELLTKNEEKVKLPTEDDPTDNLLVVVHPQDPPASAYTSSPEDFSTSSGEGKSIALTIRQLVISLAVAVFLCSIIFVAQTPVAQEEVFTTVDANTERAPATDTLDSLLTSTDDDLSLALFYLNRCVRELVYSSSVRWAVFVADRHRWSDMLHYPDYGVWVGHLWNDLFGRVVGDMSDYIRHHTEEYLPLQ